MFHKYEPSDIGLRSELGHWHNFITHGSTPRNSISMPIVPDEPLSTQDLEMLPKLLYVTMNDPDDVRAWSGTVYHMARMLEDQGFPVEYMGNVLRERRIWMKIIARGRALVHGRKPDPVDRRIKIAERCARSIEQRLEHSDADVIFSPGSIPMALLRTSKLKVFHTDATFAGIIHQYPELAEYPAKYIEEGHYLEGEALRNCDLAIYSSRWAANSAIKDYGADPGKVHVIPFGSNLGFEPSEEQVRTAIQQRSAKVCTLLFIGVHWQRKGGDIALATAEMLKRMGVDVRLNIIGSTPPNKDLPSYVQVIPFLDKRKPDDLRELVNIIQHSHFLILPSQADCTPIVVNECNSLGVPCLTSNVGGLAEMIVPNTNGQLFNSNSSAMEYAEVIAKYMKDRAAYETLARASYQEYLDNLGWKATGKRVAKVIQQLVPRRVTSR